MSDARLAIGGLALRIGVPPSGARNFENYVLIWTSPEPPVSGRDTGASLVHDLGLTQSALMGLLLSSHDPARFDPDYLDPDPPDLSTLDPFGLDVGSAYGWGSFIFLAISTDTGFAIVRSSISSLVRVPEPGAATLLGVGALALLWLRRRAW